MSGTEQREAAIGLRDTFGQVAKDVSSKAGDFHDLTADAASQGAHALADTDGEFGGKLNDLGNDPAQAPTPKPTEAPSTAGGDGAADTPGPVTDDFTEGDAGGVNSEGTNAAEAVSDPVDPISGQMLTSRLDVLLPGVLPLALRRAYTSNYRHGALFGPGWSSTLDERLLIDDDGIHFLGDDAQTLNYPVPTQPGQQVFPTAGARWPLAWNQRLDTIEILEPATGLTRHFAPPPRDAAVGAGGLVVRHLTRITDRNGNWVAFARDTDGVPLGIEHVGGYRITVGSSYRNDGFRIETLSLIEPEHPEGRPLVGYDYDPAGRLVEIRDTSGAPFIYEYDGENRITAWIDRTGYRFEYSYDATGRVARAGGEDGLLAADLAYDPKGRVTTVTNSLGQTTEYHYDQHNHVSKTIDPLGNVTHVEVDRYGRLLARTDALGQRTGYQINELGAPVVVQRPDGTTVEIEYGPHNRPTKLTGPDGSAWRYTYDAAGNTTSTTDPTGATTLYEYNEHGALVRTTDALGHSTTARVDRAGLLLEATDPLGASWRFDRDAAGRLAAATDPLGGVTVTTRDGEGRPVARTYPDGSVERWGYDANGDQTSSIDKAGNASTTEYGPFHSIRARTDQSGARYAFTHDTELKLVDVLNPQGLAWGYTFDEAGNLVAERDFNGRELRYQHDAVGLLARRTNGAGESVTFVRDAMGRIIETRHGDGPHAHATFAYDPNGALLAATSPDARVQFTRDAAGRVVAETINGRVISHEYDLLGRRSHRTTPSGHTSSWSFDAAGRPESLTTGERQITFGHDALGHEIYRWIGPSAALTSEWDQAGRLTARSLLGVAVGPEGEPVSTMRHERSWTYRADGLPESIADSLDGRSDLTVDLLGRVTAVCAANWSEAYTYDAVGNLTLANDTRVPHSDTHADEPWEATGTLLREAGRTRYTYDAQGRLISARRRTLSGTERVSTYEYDGEDRLRAVTTPDGEQWRYAYDALGRRISKQRITGDDTIHETILFTWDGSVLAEQERVLAEGSPIAVTSWDYEPGSWIPVTQTRRSHFTHAPQEVIDQQFHAIITDLVGSPTALVTPDGETTWRRATGLWGRSVTAEPDEPLAGCPLGFPGQYHDRETGLYYNNHRYYDPATGRYTTPDPLGLEPGPNQHAYVLNPLAWCDPLGLDGEAGGDTDLYHATNTAGEASIRAHGVDPSFGPRPMDFGNGFYTTRDLTQAQDWATRRFGDEGVVLHFKVPNEQLDALNTKTFEGDSQELRDFVKNYRSDRAGTSVPPYDVVEGPMLKNPKPFLRGKAPVWSGNQVVFFGDTGPMLDHALQ